MLIRGFYSKASMFSFFFPFRKQRICFLVAFTTSLSFSFSQDQLWVGKLQISLGWVGGCRSSLVVLSFQLWVTGGCGVVGPWVLLVVGLWFNEYGFLSHSPPLPSLFSTSLSDPPPSFSFEPPFLLRLPISHLRLPPISGCGFFVSLDLWIL